ASPCLNPFRWPAAACRHCASAHAGSGSHSGRRTHCLARPRVGAQGDGHSRRHQSDRRKNHCRNPASGRLRRALLPTGGGAEGRPNSFRRPGAGPRRCVSQRPVRRRPRYHFTVSRISPPAASARRRFVGCRLIRIGRNGFSLSYTLSRQAGQRPLGVLIMFKRIRRIAVSTAIVGLTWAGVAQANEPKELNFGIISTESSQNLKEQWEPFLAAMSEKTGMEIKAFFAPDYAGIIQGMRFNKVDVAWYGNKSAMEAVDRAGGEIFMQTVAADGSPGYWSLLIAHKDSPINS